MTENVSMAPARLCMNCGAAVQGAYCGQCGQRADVHVPSTVELLHEALEGITHSDSRLWRTLKTLWFRPGELTLEFIRGRRVAYLPPFRLYLVLSLLCFLAVSFVQPQPNWVIFDSADGSAAAAKSASECDVHSSIKAWEPALRRACVVSVQDHGRSLLRVAIATMPKAMFIFLPIIAFFHMLLYWRPWHRYAVHLLFFLHTHAFAFSVLLVVMLLSFLGMAWHPFARLNAAILTPLLFAALPVYGLLAMRRVFRRRWPNTLFKAAILGLVYIVVVSITITGVLMYSALHL